VREKGKRLSEKEEIDEREKKKERYSKKIEREG
jgi:hypothetical protein